MINDPAEFGLYIMQDTGVIQPCKEDDYPLMTRLKLGPNEVTSSVVVMYESNNFLRLQQEIV